MADQNQDVPDTGDSDDNAAPVSHVDLLKEIVDSQGAVLEKKDDPAPATTPPAKTTPPAQPGKDDTTGDKPQADSKKDQPESPEDPVFVKPLDNNQDSDEPEAGQKTSDQPTGKDADEAEALQTKMFSRMSELTSGTIKNEHDFRNLVEHYNELVTQAEEGFKPKFRDDAHKKAFEMLANVPKGKEIETARRTLHALALEPTKLKGKDLLFEAFLLDPENSDLSRDRAQKLFDLDFDEKYANASDNELVARALEKAERKAREVIEKTQGEFMQQAETADEQQPKVDPKIVDDIKKAAKGFAGLTLAFSEDAPESDYLKIPVNDPKEIEEIQHYVQNPNDLWKDLVSEHRNDDGSFDMQKWFRTVYEIKNLRKLQRQSYDHGFAIASRQEFNKARNSSSDKEATLQRARVPAGGKQEPKTFAEAWDNALAGKNGKGR